MTRRKQNESRNRREGFFCGGSRHQRFQRGGGFAQGDQFVRIGRRMPDHVRKAILALAEIWSELRSDPSPFENMGGGTSYDFGCIKLEAYNWMDFTQQSNLAWRHLRVRWYKYAGRAMTMNRPITPAEAEEMVRECREAFARDPRPAGKG